MSPQTLTSTLSSLRKAGSIFGVIFSRRDEVLFSDAPFVHDRLKGMAEVLDDIAFYFQKDDRNADQLAFGYDGGNLVIVFDEVYRLIVLHSIPDEVDFVAKAARAFIKDYQMSLFAQRLKTGDSAPESEPSALQSEIPKQAEEKKEPAQVEEAHPVAERIERQAEKAVDPTEPINPQALVAKSEPVVVPAVQSVPAAESGAYAVEHASVSADVVDGSGDSREKTLPTPATSTLSEAIEEEKEASEVVLNREITAPILAPVQPESTLPPPKKPSLKR